MCTGDALVWRGDGDEDAERNDDVSVDDDDGVSGRSIFFDCLSCFFAFFGFDFGFGFGFAFFFAFFSGLAERFFDLFVGTSDCVGTGRSS